MRVQGVAAGTQAVAVGDVAAPRRNGVQLALGRAEALCDSRQQRCAPPLGGVTTPAVLNLFAEGQRATLGGWRGAAAARRRSALRTRIAARLRSVASPRRPRSVALRASAK